MKNLFSRWIMILSCFLAASCTHSTDVQLPYEIETHSVIPLSNQDKLEIMELAGKFSQKKVTMISIDYVPPSVILKWGTVVFEPETLQTEKVVDCRLYFWNKSWQNAPQIPDSSSTSVGNWETSGNYFSTETKTILHLDSGTVLAIIPDSIPLDTIVHVLNLVYGKKLPVSGTQDSTVMNLEYLCMVAWSDTGANPVITLITQSCKDEFCSTSCDYFLDYIDGQILLRRYVRCSVV